LISRKTEINLAFDRLAISLKRNRRVAFDQTFPINRDGNREAAIAIVAMD